MGNDASFRMISGSRMGYAGCVLPYRNNLIVALGKYEFVGSFIHISYYPKNDALNC
jgi:hypothetical protein